VVDEAQVFLEECLASPIGHILALRSHLEGVGESMPYISMDSLNDVTIYLTHACNLRCIHCYLSAGEPLGNELNVRDWLIILDKLRELGVRFVYLLGGEPMLLVRRGLLGMPRTWVYMYQ
jgi:Predicted Fe-S oxidoreductases